MKNNEQDISIKLKHSESVRSLIAERECIAVLEKLGWTCKHSCYYEDRETKKLREVDILATQRWKQIYNQQNYYLRLNLVLECKSNKGFHLLFWPEHKARWLIRSRYNLPKYSLAREDNHPYLAEQLKLIDFTDDDIAEVLHELDETTENNVHSLALFPILPPLPKVYTSAFRETNTEREKDLDNSVLWRAGQVVQSAIEGFLHANFMRDCDWIASRKAAAIQGYKSTLDEAITSWKQASSTIEYYHPLVVIESPLWIITGKRLTQINWCRLEQQRPRELQWWFDVVSKDYFSEYANAVTKHYESILKKAGAQLAFSS